MDVRTQTIACVHDTNGNATIAYYVMNEIIVSINLFDGLYIKVFSGFIYKYIYIYLVCLQHWQVKLYWRGDKCIFIFITNQALENIVNLHNKKVLIISSYNGNKFTIHVKVKHFSVPVIRKSLDTFPQKCALRQRVNYL